MVFMLRFPSSQSWAIFMYFVTQPSPLPLLPGKGSRLSLKSPHISGGCLSHRDSMLNPAQAKHSPVTLPYLTEEYQHKSGKCVLY